MAILSATILQDAIHSMEARFGKFENRLSEYGALQSYKDNAPMMLAPSTVTNLKKSIVQPVKVPVLNKSTTSVITAPSCNPVGGRPTSAFKALTWAYKGFEVQVIPSVNEGNYVGLAEDLGQQLRMGWKALFSNMDTAAVTSLEANKNAVVAASAYTDKITASAAGYDYTGDPKEFILYRQGLLKINDMEDGGNDVANAESISNQLLIQTYGQNNQQNLEAINRGFKNFYSNRVVPGANKEVHYLFPEGSVGIYNWTAPDNRTGRVAGNKSWEQMQDPMFGFDWEVYKVKDCIDASAEMAGNTRAYGEIWQIGAYFAYLTEYSSDTSSPIIKVTLNSAP
jgi:hypothetical protein